MLSYSVLSCSHVCSNIFSVFTTLQCYSIPCKEMWFLVSKGFILQWLSFVRLLTHPLVKLNLSTTINTKVER